MICVIRVPFAFITKMSLFSGTQQLLMKAICVPSGDQSPRSSPSFTQTPVARAVEFALASVAYQPSSSLVRALDRAGFRSSTAIGRDHELSPRIGGNAAESG